MSFVAIAACAAEDATPTTTEALSALTCPPVVRQHALVETDPTVMQRFPLTRVLQQLIQADGSISTIGGIWTQFRTTYTTNCGAQFDPHGYGLQCRPNITIDLANFDPSGGQQQQFTPVGLFDRFDLAPADGADCGEYRIVYAAQNAGGIDRGFMIFEARLPNPTPSQGLAGCVPVADFWASLSTDDDATDRANKLDAFYFTGLGNGFGPVVAPANYGLPRGPNGKRHGQIRTDFFFDGEWNLREFQLAHGTCVGAGGASGCTLLMDQVTVKVNPGKQLFDGTNALAPQYQSAFLAQIPALSASKAARIGMTNADKFNTMESVSTSNDMNYDQQASAAFRQTVEDADPTFTASELFQRATTQTCAGCHQLSTNRCLGPGACGAGLPGVQWPNKFAFVQIDERGTLSDALTSTFLPFRHDVLQKFLKAACDGGALSDGSSDRTLGGGGLDSPN